MRRALWVVGLVGCTLVGCTWNYGGTGGSDGSGPHDSAVVHDAAPPPPYCSPGCYPENTVTVECKGTLATVTQPQRPINPMYCCMQGPLTQSATCSSGCAVQGALTFTVQSAIAPPRPAMFCAGATEAQLGDFCPTTPCIPTRAVVATDGTVASEAYLTCGTSSRCETTPAPMVASYLGSCDAATLAQYGVANVHGVVVVDSPADRSACLLAWDSGAQAVRSGITVKCVGDWQCPQGSLCDDQIPLLVASTHPVAICKPGPRGTLAPAMLSP